MSSTRLIAAICTSQILAQIGAFSVPALLPELISQWSLSNTEAGWVTGIFYAGYTLSVPVLVSLTDRVDPRTVYLFGVSTIGSKLTAHQSLPHQVQHLATPTRPAEL